MSLAATATAGLSCCAAPEQQSKGTAASATPASSGPPPSRGTHLVMLGTQGGPIPGARAATSTALVVDGAIYLIDAGSGLPVRFSESGLDFAQVRAMFITHMHSDHYIDAFNFFSLNWTNWKFPDQQVAVHGPGRADLSGPEHSSSPGLPEKPHAPLVVPDAPTPGIEEFFDLSIRANAYDINERLRSTRRHGDVPMDLTGRTGDALMKAHAIKVPQHANVVEHTPQMQPIAVYEDDRVRVTATLVDHPPVFPAFAFRFDTDDASVVFSGDTTPNDNLSALAHGADVLVNEVMDIEAATARFKGSALYATMANQFATAHTPSRDWTPPGGGARKPGVGRVAHECGAKALVLNHVYPGDGSVPDRDFKRAAERNFSRPVVVSRDLMTISLASLV
ncbi:MBL fold metallo-hydrolase [Streptomyces odontomachi]|uniref:MBL fold metallo-hydrolase n=1 Tax=Streptomyces odontomachi TaxID=2944940 RepID=UPI002108BCC6|nr:MBL fold metallo-hydrolase [Streptomyces sp. ODS25]